MVIVIKPTVTVVNKKKEIKKPLIFTNTLPDSVCQLSKLMFSAEHWIYLQKKVSHW
jgi:hypothetical protein